MKVQNERHISRYLKELSELISNLERLAPQIDEACGMWINALRRGNKVIFCGNGGSAADAQHLAAELMGRFLIDRNPLPAISLTVDTSALTAIGNDYGYENVFERQLRGISRPGDVLVGLSTSGNSENVVRAFSTAKALQVSTIALTGDGGGRLNSLADLTIAVPSRKTNHIQEAHIAIGHLVCGIVEEQLCNDKL